MSNLTQPYESFAWHVTMVKVTRTVSAKRKWRIITWWFWWIVFNIVWGGKDFIIMTFSWYQNPDISVNVTFWTPQSQDQCTLVKVRGCYQVLFTPERHSKIHNSLLQPSVMLSCISLTTLFFQSNMKQTREQAILLFSGIFNCDEKGLCRFL